MSSSSSGSKPARRVPTQYAVAEKRWPGVGAGLSRVRIVLGGTACKRHGVVSGCLDAGVARSISNDSDSPDRMSVVCYPGLRPMVGPAGKR